MKRIYEEGKQTLKTSALFSVVVLLIMLLVVGIILIVIFILMNSGVLEQGDKQFNLKGFVIGISICSIALGATLTPIAARIPMRPVNTLLHAMERLVNGDYKTRLEYEGIMGHNLAAVNTFNQLAEELDNTEMMRSDFINNFSHEFKTPIVSIAGFAKLLKYDDTLDEQQRLEYLDIIEEESMRLSSMATNVLALTKVENQTILTNISEFNLSEQIRNCVLLMENKWTKKNIDLSLEFDEITISGNEEQLKQVWINLLDNAIKYAPQDGRVSVNISQNDSETRVVVSNNGEPIPENAINKVFNKFYQADESHASPGNGVGLAIVKKIVLLHNGDVEVESTPEKTSFTVIL